MFQYGHAKFTMTAVHIVYGHAIGENITIQEQIRAHFKCHHTYKNLRTTKITTNMSSLHRKPKVTEKLEMCHASLCHAAPACGMNQMYGHQDLFSWEYGSLKKILVV